MFDPFEMSMAASQAMGRLQESGSVGYVETTLTKVYETNEGSGMVPLEDFSLVKKGTQCVVKYAGQVYETTAYEDSEGTLTIGDDSEYGEGEHPTDEPFYIAFVVGVGALTFLDDDTATFELYVKTETIHPIDKKYLPDMGGGLPVVEISGELVESGIECTDTENAALQTAVETGLPCVLKIAALGLSAVAINIEMGFAVYYGAERIICQKLETGEWMVMIQNE